MGVVETLLVFWRKMWNRAAWMFPARNRSPLWCIVMESWGRLAQQLLDSFKTWFTIVMAWRKQNVEGAVQVWFDAASSFQMLFKWRNDEGGSWCFEVLCRKFQSSKKMQNERVRVFSVMAAVILGFKWAENDFKYDCLRFPNDVLNWFCFNEVICILLSLENMEVEGVWLHDLGLETGCRQTSYLLFWVCSWIANLDLLKWTKMHYLLIMNQRWIWRWYDGMLLNFGLGTSCKWHLKWIPIGQLCQKCLNQKSQLLVKLDF